MKQTPRVLRALQRHPEGICQADFMPPNIIDGGGLISRLAARVRDLKDQGHNVQADGERWGFTVYRLVPDVEAPAVAAPDAQPPAAPADDGSLSTGALFDMPPQSRNAILDDAA